MTKARSKHKPAARTATAPARSRSKPAPSRATATAQRPRRPTPATTTAAASPAGTKHQRILALLRSETGATLPALVAATQWQPHSVRGFLAGVVRKKLGLDLVSEVTDHGRVYRIADAAA